MNRLRLSGWVREALRGSSRGFTLIEVLVTVALIGVIAVALMSFMSVAASSLIHADERTIAESLARSQLEFVKNQVYNDTLVSGEATYPKIPAASIPVGYTIWSVDSDGAYVNGGASDDVVAIPWDSDGNKPDTTGIDTGLQMVALVIEHDGKVIYTFVNNNPDWAGGVEMTLQGYVRNSDQEG
jgi:prepilin-type N-terminal cleavage/methylation domain-containing protein